MLKYEWKYLITVFLLIIIVIKKWLLNKRKGSFAYYGLLKDKRSVEPTCS